MLQSLANGDDAYLIIAFGVDDREDYTRKHAESNVTRVAIVFARVLDRNERSREDLIGVAKVYAVFREVDLLLRFVPRVHSVATSCSCVKTMSYDGFKHCVSPERGWRGRLDQQVRPVLPFYAECRPIRYRSDG